MNNFLEHLAVDVHRFWMRVLKGLNGFAITIGGIVIWVHATYPGIEGQLLAALPVKGQFLVLAAFGGLVHAVTRQASKAAGQ